MYTYYSLLANKQKNAYPLLTLLDIEKFPASFLREKPYDTIPLFRLQGCDTLPFLLVQVRLYASSDYTGAKVELRTDGSTYILSLSNTIIRIMTSPGISGSIDVHIHRERGSGTRSNAFQLHGSYPAIRTV